MIQINISFPQYHKLLKINKKIYSFRLININKKLQNYNKKFNKINNI